MRASEKIPMFKCGMFSRYNNIDGTTSCYRNMDFIGAFENTSAFCDLYSSLATEIEQKDKRIKELESTTLELQSELARKKMSLTVACNRVEELEDRLKVAVDCLQRAIDEE